MVDFITVAYVVFGIFIAALGGVVLFLLWKKKHPYKVRVRRLTSNNTKVIRDAIGKIKKDKQGVEYLKVWYGINKKPLPIKLPIPSADVTEYDAEAGRLVVEAWFDDARGFTYVKDPVNMETLNSLKDEEGFRVFPSNSREMLINELSIANSMKPKTTPEVIMYMTPFIALIMILTVFMIFYGKAIEPATAVLAESQDYQLQWIDKASQIQASQDNLFRNMVNRERGQPVTSVERPPEAGGT